MKNHYSNIIFDLDGTLSDPKDGIIKSIKYAIDQLGYSIPDGYDLDWCIGPPLRYSFSIIFESNDKAFLEKALAVYRKRYSIIGKYENILYPNIEEMLIILLKTDLSLYVATSKPILIAKEILQHFSLIKYFTGIYGSELNGNLVDKKELISFVLEEEKLSKNETIMIGDRKYDIIGAKHNKIFTGGVCYGYGSVDELKEAGVDHLFSSPKEISDFLTN